tara:strand:+ start:121 stop:750 length:630 start_codon:yes stop_codon:yes gene_type:complete
MEEFIKLWGSGTARTLRPIWMAEELEIRYELMPIGPRTGETQTEEFTQINPKQKIPALQYKDLNLSESLAICRYLQKNFSSKNIFIPIDDLEIAKEDEWCNFIYGELDETSLYVMRRHYDLKDIYGESPVVVEACRKYFMRQLNIVENHLKSNQSILRSGFGLADIFLMTCLDWAVFYEFSLPKNTAQYRDRIATRPAYEKAMKINYSS